MISRSSDVGAAARSRQRGFMLNPYRFGVPTDPNFASVALLLNGAEADSTTAWTDLSPTPKTIARVGTHISNVGADAKFGASGITAVTTRDSILTAGAVADWKFLNGGTKFTLEAWIKFADFSVVQGIIATSAGSTANIGLYLALNTSRNFDLQVYFGSVGNYIVNGTFGTFWPNDSSYHFLQLTFDPTLGSNHYALAVDNANSSFLSKTGNTASASNPSQTLSIGGINASSPSSTFLGSIGHIRLTNGVVRPFTLPGAAFPTS